MSSRLRGLCTTGRWWPTALAVAGSLGVLVGDVAAKPVLDFVSSLPSEVEGYRRSEPELYTPHSLFHYINGGAELYISYAFESVAALEYTPAEGNEIRVDIFDMGSSENAFGIFAHGRESIAREVGQGSEYAAGLLTFFRDRYYVSLLAYPESPAKKRILYSLARHIERAIGGDGPLPAIVDALPPAHLDPASVKYFRHHNWLNTHCFVSNDNILGIGPHTEAALAAYADGDNRWSVVVVRYPDAAQAENARRSFVDAFLAGATAGWSQRSDGTWSGIARRDDQLTVVLRAGRGQDVRTVLQTAGGGP